MIGGVDQGTGGPQQLSLIVVVLLTLVRQQHVEVRAFIQWKVKCSFGLNTT